jgi:hypothetical protein
LPKWMKVDHMEDIYGLDRFDDICFQK